MVFEFDAHQLYEGRKYCRVPPLEHSALLLTYIKRGLGLKPTVWSLRVAVLHRCNCTVFVNYKTALV